MHEKKIRQTEQLNQHKKEQILVSKCFPSPLEREFVVLRPTQTSLFSSRAWKQLSSLHQSSHGMAGGRRRPHFPRGGARWPATWSSRGRSVMSASCVKDGADGGTDEKRRLSNLKDGSARGSDRRQRRGAPLAATRRSTCAHRLRRQHQ
jgi:hypothetical protein